jgi:hypothetical protein
MSRSQQDDRADLRALIDGHASCYKGLENWRWGLGLFGLDDDAGQYPHWATSVLAAIGQLRDYEDLYAGLTSGNANAVKKRKAYHFLVGLATTGRMKSLALNPVYNSDGNALWKAIEVAYQSDGQTQPRLRRLLRYIDNPAPDKGATCGEHYNEIAQALAAANNLAAALNQPLITEVRVLNTILNLDQYGKTFCIYFDYLTYKQAAMAVHKDGEPKVARDDATLKEFFDRGAEVLREKRAHSAIHDSTHQPDRIQPGTVSAVDAHDTIAPHQAAQGQRPRICAFFLSARGCDSSKGACTHSHDIEEAKKQGVCILALQQKCPNDRHSCSKTHLRYIPAKGSDAPRAPSKHGANKSRHNSGGGSKGGGYKSSGGGSNNSANKGNKSPSPCYSFLEGKCSRRNCNFKHDQALKDKFDQVRGPTANAATLNDQGAAAAVPPTSLPPPPPPVTAATIGAMIAAEFERQRSSVPPGWGQM